MTGSIASSVFVTGPSDSVAVADVYAATPVPKPLNTAVKSITDTTLGAAEALKATAIGTVAQAKAAITQTSSIEGLTNLLKTGQLDPALIAGLPTTKEAALDLVKNIADNAVSQLNVLKDLKGDVLTDLLSAVGFKDNPAGLAAGILGLPGSTAPINVLLADNPKLKVIYDSVVFTHNAGDLNTVQGVVSLLNSLTGNSELASVVDMQSQFAVMSTILNKSKTLQIPAMVDAVFLKAGTAVDRKKFSLSILGTMLNNADMITLSKIMDNVSPQSVVAHTPDAVSVILQNYRLPEDTPVATMTQYTQLTTLLGRIDAHWGRYERNSVYVTDLGVFGSCSKDAMDVLRLLPGYDTELLIAGQYKAPVDLLGLAKTNYPLAAI